MPKPHGGRLINRVLVGEEREKTQGRLSELRSLPITEETAKEVQNIAHGIFSPLEGFLTRQDYFSVLNQ